MCSYMRRIESNGSYLGLPVVRKQCPPEDIRLHFIIVILGYKQVQESEFPVFKSHSIKWYRGLEISLLGLLCASRYQKKMCQEVSFARDWTIEKDGKAESTVIIWM